jgi:hypothetical protein
MYSKTYFVCITIYRISQMIQPRGQEHNSHPSPHLEAEEGLKVMQIGGSIPRMERTAEGILQIPSPQISPDATATA